jgi:hypothetical protein
MLVQGSKQRKISSTASVTVERNLKPPKIETARPDLHFIRVDLKLSHLNLAIYSTASVMFTLNSPIIMHATQFRCELDEPLSNGLFKIHPMCFPDVIQIKMIWRSYISYRIFRRRTHIYCPLAQRAWREDSTQQRA